MNSEFTVARFQATRWPSILAKLQWEFQADSGAKMRSPDCNEVGVEML